MEGGGRRCRDYESQLSTPLSLPTQAAFTVSRIIIHAFYRMTTTLGHL